MLRGFLLAVLGLGVLMQWTTAQLMPSADANPTSLLLVAWGAAALYAIGAAVTLFSAEREEQTRDFLMRLPGQWLPIFAAKVATALASAFALGLILCLTGAWVGGGVWASTAEFQNAAALGGVAVLEATAWGLLFSLCMKQPLLAAVTAIGAASFGAQLAIAATPAAYHTFSLNSYHEAVPMRLLLTLVVFATNVWLGSRWLQIVPRRVTAKSLAADQTDAIKDVVRPQGIRRGVIARLLWQTWRESWKTILATLVLAIFLMFALALPLGLFQNSTPYADLPFGLLTLLFVPALLGAFVFRADQRDDHRQFLVAHAAWPRYVWLARQLVWGASLFVIIIATSLATWGAFVWISGDELNYILRRGYSGHFFSVFFISGQTDQPWELATLFDRLFHYVTQFTVATWTSFFTAYALGQFCSLLFKREVLAGLLALLFSMVLAAWVVVTGLWQLNSLWFVLPIGIGAMLATWLRMPHWMVARNHPKSWAFSVAAIALPILLVTVTLPSARLGQLKDEPGHQQFLEQVEKYDASRSEGVATALAYEQLYASLMNGSGDYEKGIADLIQITQRPHCRFPIVTNWRETHSRYEELGNLRAILLTDTKRGGSARSLERALERYLAVVRLHKHSLEGQLSSTVGFIEREGYVHHGRHDTRIDKTILSWASRPQQTSELLLKAVAELQKNLTLDFQSAILADRELIRAVLLDKKSPRFLQEDHPRWTGYLAYLANQFPWERQRALRALDIRTEQLLDYAMTAQGANQHLDDYISAKARRKLIGRWHDYQAPMPHQSVYRYKWHAYQRATQNAWQANTSFLAAQELDVHRSIRGFVIQTLQARTRRIGLITQLALIAYRIDHQKYPETLAELSPKYLHGSKYEHGLPLDPYGDRPLKYRPQGFDFPMMIKYRDKHEMDKSELASTIVPEHTPLLWSVGVSDCEPKEGQLTLALDPEAELPLDEEDEQEIIDVIRLEPTAWAGWYPPMIFPLPKIKPPELPANNQPKEKDAEEVEE